MTWFDPERSEGARLDEDARAWLPTGGDPRAHEAIVVLLARVAATGVDPIAALRDAVERWFGREAATALPPSASTGSPHAGGDDGAITLEPLPPLRRPTMWPQRPKRLPGELFSSWLRRAAVAAGVAPYRFALEAIGRRLADPDRGVSDATLHRLALATGQSVEDLAGGTLRPAWSSERPSCDSGARRARRSGAEQDRLAAVHDVVLRDGRLVLTRASSTRDGRPRPLLQYCPRCLAEDDPPRFYRSWRLMHEVACPRHRCRLLDVCWWCNGAHLDPLAQRTALSHPSCAACEAALADAPVQDAPATVLRLQRDLARFLHRVAADVAPKSQPVYLDRLALRLVTAERSVAARERAPALPTRTPMGRDPAVVRRSLHG